MGRVAKAAASASALILAVGISCGALSQALPNVPPPTPLPNPGKSPIERFQLELVHRMYMCTFSQQIYEGKPTSESSTYFRTCVENSKKAATILYSSAAKTMKSGAARAALKNYLIIWIATMDGLTRAHGESPRDYSARQAAAERRLAEAWTAVEVELL